MTIRIVIADDQALVRSGLRALLEHDPELVVVSEVGDGSQAIHAASTADPDVVLMDIRMPGIDGIAATRQITQTNPTVAVVVLTTFDIDEYVFAAIRAGAAGFLLKDGDADELRRAIHAAVAGDALMAPRALRRLMTEFAAAPSPDPDLEARAATLTPRERDVLEEVAKGLSNREIAAGLAIGEATAKTHVGSLLVKLHCRDRAQLVVFAYESGTLRPSR